ncbi:MAG: S8 family serine peptidase [Flavobacteriales bacterium]|nr:S8 family serine peptidase [Flavobacteriales bacterium]
MFAAPIFTRASVDPAAPHRFAFKQRVALEQDPGRVAVLMTPAFLAQVKQQGLPVFAIGPERVEPHAVAGWVLLNVKPRGNEAMEALVRGIAKQPGVLFASPVFVDDLGGPMFVTPTVLAAFTGGVGADAKSALLRDAGLAIEEEFPAVGVTLLRTLSARTGYEVLEAANTLALRAELQAAEPDMIFTGRGDFVPNDAQFTSCWGLLNTGQSGGTAGIDMKASQAWDLTQGNSTIITVIIDTGVDQAHPDIQQVPGTNTTTDASTTGGPVNSFDNHGTAVAGCVSATINNTIGTVGVAPGTRSASARTMISTSSSGAWNSQASWTVASINWATTIGARVTNNSNYYGFTSATIETAYINTRNAGMVHFASAGNDASNALSYPSSLPSVNAVSAISRTGALASFSNFNTNLSYSAPGVSVNSTDRTGAPGYNTSDYAVVQGTSFASPYAAGVAALVLSANPALTAVQVEQLMETTATDLGTAGFDNIYGYGLVNAFAALNQIYRPYLLARIILEGPYDSGPQLMRDDLRSQGLVPAAEPYTALGYTYLNGGGETTTPAVLAVTGSNAIVDWVIVELRTNLAPTTIMYSRAALLQRDGEVVDMDGFSPVRCNVVPGLYHISFRHRNHLGFCASDQWNLNLQNITVADFTGTVNNVFGTNARKDLSGKMGMWAGDVTFNNQLKYAGSANDRDPILTAIGGAVPTNTVSGYLGADINMNGQVKYAGSANDRDILLQNIGGCAHGGAERAVAIESVPLLRASVRLRREGDPPGIGTSVFLHGPSQRQWKIASYADASGIF